MVTAYFPSLDMPGRKTLGENQVHLVGNKGKIQYNFSTTRGLYFLILFFKANTSTPRIS